MQLVSQAPRKPLASPYMIYQAITSIKVGIPEVTGFVTGGSPLLSYNLQYRSETTLPIEFTTLIGEVPDSMALDYLKFGLQTDVVYDFRYRVKNKHGWGPFSDFV